MGIGQRQLARVRPAHDAQRIRRVQVRARHQLHRPRLAAGRQHLGHRPVAPLIRRRARAQLHIVDPFREHQLGLRRDQRALLERDGARHQQHVALIALRRVEIGQGYVGRPRERLKRRAGREHRARAQARADGQVHRLVKNAAGGVQQLPGGIAHVARQHHAGGQGQFLVQRGLDRQAGARGQRGGLQGQGVVQRLATRKFRAFGQFHAATRQHHIAAKRLCARRQDPAVLVIRRGRGRRKAVVDAAVDVQVALGAQRQRARFARAIDGSHRRVRVQAGVAIARQVQVTLHDQIAIARLADNFHARAQMEDIAVAGVIQACKLGVQEIAIGPRAADERGAVAVQRFQIRLINDLIFTTARAIRRNAFPGVVIALGGDQRDGLGAVYRDRAARLDGDVAIRGGGTRHPAAVVGRVASGVNTRRKQVQGAARHTVVLPRARSRRGRRAVAQINARAAGKRQHATTRIQLHHGAVGRVDDLAVAIHAQHRSMRVQHRVRRQGQAIARGHADPAHALAAGVHPAGHGQAAAVDRQVDVVGAQRIAQRQAALLDLETARAGDAAVVQALIQRVEIRVQGARRAQTLRADIDAARAVGHGRAARIVDARARTQDAALQVHHAGRGRQRVGPQAARIVLLRRQIDQRPAFLPDAALAAGQNDVAAPAVAQHVVEGDGPARHVQLRGRRQQHAVAAFQCQLAAGQHDPAIDLHVRPGQADFRAQVLHRRGLQSRQTRRGRHPYIAARRHAVDGTRPAGQQGRVQVEVAAHIGVAARGAVERALRFIDRQAASMVGGDAVAGIEVDVGKAQRQPGVVVQPAGLRALPITELDPFGVDAQRAVARAGPTRRHRARRLGCAIPDQVLRADAGLVARAAVAIDGRGAQRQRGQAVLAGQRIARVQRHRAIEVKGIARGQRQGFQRRCAHAGVAAQQAAQDVLVQRQAVGQDAARGGLRQRLGRADIHRAHCQGQVAGAVAHLFAQIEYAIGGGGDGALGIQAGHALAGLRRAGADADGARAQRVRRQHIQTAIGHRKQTGGAWLEGIAVGGIHRRRASAQRGYARAGFKFDRARRDQHFRPRQLRARAQHHLVGRRLEGIEAAARPVPHYRQRADDQTAGAQRVQGIRLHRRALEPCRGGLARRQDLYRRAAAIERHGAAEAALRGGEIRQPFNAQRLPVRGPRMDRQPQGAGVGRQHRTRHTARHGIGRDKAGIAHFVVLRQRAQHLARRQDHRAGQAVHHVRTRGRQGAAGRPGLIAHLHRRKRRAR
ncbi:hypothetical protein D3C72_514620 [compost metagenome]